jgi:hypothetical protein
MRSSAALHDRLQYATAGANEQVNSYPLLGELESAFVAAHLQQLLNTALVGGETQNLTHDLTHKRDTLGLGLYVTEKKTVG